MPIHVYEPRAGIPPQATTGRYVVLDLDGTLVVSKSGRLIARGWDDCIVHPSATAAIEQLRKSYNVLIVTNQAIVQQAVADKLQQAADFFGVVVMAAMGKGCAERKPAPHMWQAYTQRYGVTDAPSEIIYCGDAAGPIHSGGFPDYEWSDVDYGFAQAIGARFILPHQLMPSPNITVDPTMMQVILLMGVPGSGKTEFAKYLVLKLRELSLRANECCPAWEVIEQDAYGKRQKAHEALHRALIAKASAVIDATHPSRARRREVLQIANMYNVRMRIIWLVRNGREGNRRRAHPVPEVAFNAYSKNFEDPRDDGVPVDIVM